MKKSTQDDKRIDELISIGEEVLENSIEVENYEASRDISNLISALKTKDIEIVKKELEKYNITRIEYKGFPIKIVHYQDLFASHVSYAGDVLYEKIGDTLDECETDCKLFIDTLTLFFDGLDKLTRM